MHLRHFCVSFSLFLPLYFLLRSHASCAANPSTLSTPSTAGVLLQPPQPPRNSFGIQQQQQQQQSARTSPIPPPAALSSVSSTLSTATTATSSTTATTYCVVNAPFRVPPRGSIVGEAVEQLRLLGGMPTPLAAIVELVFRNNTFESSTKRKPRARTRDALNQFIAHHPNDSIVYSPADGFYALRQGWQDCYTSSSATGE